MSNNLKESMQAFSDQRILNNIRQQNSFSAASVEVAKEIAIERGLLTEAQIEGIDQKAQYETDTGQTKLYGSETTATTTTLTVGTVLLVIWIIFKFVLNFA